jgi:hypothetical protein
LAVLEKKRNRAVVIATLSSSIPLQSILVIDKGISMCRNIILIVPLGTTIYWCVDEITFMGRMSILDHVIGNDALHIRMFGTACIMTDRDLICIHVLVLYVSIFFILILPLSFSLFDFPCGWSMAQHAERTRERIVKMAKTMKRECFQVFICIFFVIS